MRRLIVVEFFSHGGLLHYSWQLAQGLARAGGDGLEVVLLTGPHPECRPGPSTPPNLRLLPELGTWNPQQPPPGLGRVLPRRLLRAGRALIYLRAWMRIVRVTRRERPDWILLGDFEHACDLWGARWLRRAGRRRAGAPGWRVADVWHNVEAFDRERVGALVRQPRWRLRLARSLDAVFVHGRELARQFEAFARVQPVAIAHGNQDWIVAQAGPDPDLRARLHLARADAVGLLIGNLSPYKGVEVLLDALAQIPPPRRPRIVIAGRPAANVRPEAWRRHAAALGLDPWLRWCLEHVPLEELAWYLRAADFLVLPYCAASQSGVAHLGLTLGKPLIVTAVGGLPELVDGNGFAVPAGDAEALALALERMAGDTALRQRCSRRSAELARSRHDWESIAREMLAALGMPLVAIPRRSRI